MDIELTTEFFYDIGYLEPPTEANEENRNQFISLISANSTVCFENKVPDCNL